MRKNVISYFGGAALFMLGIGGGLLPDTACSETFVVKNGRPLAEIIIANAPARMTKVAASNLQEYVFKITGATLAITNVPGKDVPVKIYVGKSKFTDDLKLSTEGLAHGAFRMASGKDWLALLGPDKDFVPIEPWTHNNADSTRAKNDWDALNALTGDYYGFPYSRMYRMYSPELDVWPMDDGGTMNAVCEFLRSLGVRWYFPGELGEVVPKMKSIALTAVDKTVKPDFPMRFFGYGYPGHDNTLWNLRMGVNYEHEIMGLTQYSHGSKWVYMRDEVKQAHPDWYALLGGKRATDHSYSGAPCLSSGGLFKQHLKFARMMFDVRKESMLSLDMCDGYGACMCACVLCKGQETPQRGSEGNMSDYVWGYVNRAATELYKTHPDRKVSGLSYSAYMVPPEKIDKFSPNLAIILCQWRSAFHDPATRAEALKLRQAWLAKLPSKEIYIYDYYLNSWPRYSQDGLPVYFPRLIAEDLRSLKGISKGDMIEVYRHGDPKSGNWNTWDPMATMHLNIYVTTRLWWDAGQDLDALLDEYYKLFYGPAGREMKAFVEYSEKNWPLIKTKLEVLDKTLELLAAARKAAGDTIYGKRVDLVVEYCQSLKQLRERLAKGRKNVPGERALDVDKITLDGKLDEWNWKVRVCDMKEMETGRTPDLGSSFRFVWGADQTLYLGIRCNERDTKALNITTTTNDDAKIRMGDAVELLIETQSHSYYRITVNPAGALADADMKDGTNTLWSSGATAAAYIGDGFWSLEVRLPAAGDAEQAIDPLHGISGRKPSFNFPWCVNVCRQRVRQNETERSAWSPTGSSRFDDVMKFGAIYVGGYQ